MKGEKKVSIVGSVGVPAKYGGFETLAEQLALRLNSEFPITVFCSKKKYPPSERIKSWNNIKRYFINLNANGVQSIAYDAISIIIASFNNNVILILGGSGTFILPFIRLVFRNKKIIFHPDGLEWKRGKWNYIGKLFLKVSIKMGVYFSHHIILDNKALAKYIKTPSDKTSFISYGGNSYNSNSKQNNSYWLTIARAEKENNLELIANSFQQTPNERWVLLSNYSQTKYGKLISEKYSSATNITFLNENYNAKYIGELLANCKGIIHGHSTGGTNPSLVAAMWSRKVIYCHNNPFNRQTTNNKALYFSSSIELNTLLTFIPSEKISEDLFKHAKQFFNWELICNEYKKLFNSI